MKIEIDTDKGIILVHGKPNLKDLAKINAAAELIKINKYTYKVCEQKNYCQKS